MIKHQPLGGRLLTMPFLFFSALALIAAVIIAQRFMYGIGSVTHVNDGYTWGIWVVIDVVIGTAFGCAGYVMAFIVYIMNRGEYHPLVRPAVLASLFGYTLGGIGVMLDLGRYWQFYNMFLPKLAHTDSVMLEVGWCVAAYALVLWIELSPVFLERFGFHDIRRRLNKVLFAIVALGVLLPTMHQSSLGTMLVLIGHQLSPLWQTQFLPLLYVSSAILMGFGIVIFEAILSSHHFGRPQENPLLSGLAKMAVWILALFLMVRIGDLSVRGVWGLAFSGTLEGFFFLLEMALHLAALWLMVHPQWRQKTSMLFWASISLLAAGILLRLNSYLIGYHPAGGPWSYFPSITEMMVTLGLFSLEVVLYLYFVKRMPVLYTEKYSNS